MIALFRLIIFLVLLEAALYFLLWIYMRSLRREALEGEWDERHPDRAGDSSDREEFVRRSMVNFEKSLRARLLWLVFIIPTVAVMGIIYWVNWQ